MRQILACFVLGVALGTAIFACKKQQACELQNQIVDGATTAIGSALACKNPAALKPYLLKVVSPLKICETSTEMKTNASLWGTLCAQGAALALDAGVSALPADAGCAGGVAVDAAKAAATATCYSIFP